MKDFETKTKSNIEYSVKKKQQIERELVGKMLPFQGHRIWEVNIETLEVKEAQFVNTTTVHFYDKPKKEIMIVKGCVYISALNEGNALKKYKKGVNGSRVINKPMSL